MSGRFWSRRGLRTLTVLSVFAVGGSFACDSAKETQPSQAEKNALIPVGVVVLQARDALLTAELPGRAAAFETSEVRPQVTGILQQRLFTEGQMVKRGQTLYQIDPRLYRSALAQARADLQGAEATAVAAKEKATRFDALSGEGLVTALELAEVRAAAGQAAARVEQARAAVETARLQLAFTQVTAPIDGRIGRSVVTTGALVTAGQPTSLATIQRLDPMFVDLQESSATVTELRRSLAQGGMLPASTKVRLRLEDGSVYQHEGTLQFSESMVDPNTGSVTLRASFPNPDHVLLPGMYVRAIVEQGEQPRAILAPQRGVMRDSRGQPIAYVVGDNDVIEQREIVATRTIGEQWLIQSGLADGERLVVEGTSKVRPGQRVQPQPFEGAPGGETVSPGSISTSSNSASSSPAGTTGER